MTLPVNLRMEKLYEIVVKWNLREITGDQAMYKIDCLFSKFGVDRKWKEMAQK